MAKIGRREYLKLMAAGGAGLAAASNFELFHLTQAATLNHQPKGVTQKVSTQLNWPITNTPPPLTPFVTAVFSGLMGFFYNPSSNECKVGFHPGHGNHRLKVTILRNSAVFNPQPPIPSHIRDMTLRLAGQPRGPNFFQTQDPIFNRTTGHDQDFRWLPDLDGDDFYPLGHGKNKGKFTNWLHVKDGTFYTRDKTVCTFNRINVGNRQVLGYFGPVAKLMATSINVNEDVLLQINGVDIPLQYVAGHSYEIRIDNECSNNGIPCSWEIDHPSDEKKRNHFHFAREVLKLRRGTTRIGLKIVPGSSNPLCKQSILASTDAAPCMGAGYGQNGV